MFVRAGIAYLAIALSLLAGCSRDTGQAVLVHIDPYAPEGSILVAGNREWTETGVEVIEGEALSIVAHGSVRHVEKGDRKRDVPVAVGPSGTFFFSDKVAEKHFPLPSAAGGPAPCYCLIGRIGNGPAFYVGRSKSWNAAQSGLLQLGINDFDHSDNSGQLYAQVTKPASVQPVGFEENVPYATQPGSPLPGSSVVIIYVDGLRPDVVREMAAMGHLPNINGLFIEGGTWCSNTFTAFPSDTITSNGTMWTGCFSDRHGLKGQVRFSRRTLYSASYLEPLGPIRSSRLLAPQGLDKFVQNTQAASIRLLRGQEAGNRWQSSETTDTAPIYERLRAEGSDWATGVLPLMTDVPPPLWTRSMVRHLPYMGAQQAWKYVDDANTDYAIGRLIAQESPVTIVWLPETDSVSHKMSRGQFGMTRRTIAEVDILVGRIVDELENQKRLASTYLMLISDHGHHGGQRQHLSHFDLANDLLFKPRELLADGRWVGGGLGLSVRQHRFWNRHPGDASREFVFVDGNSDGVARLFLPRRHYRSRDWMGQPRAGDMLAYKVADHLPPVNLIESLTSATGIAGDGTIAQPVDLVLTKLSGNSILISTDDRGHAVIDRKKESSGRWIYKYTPVEGLKRTPDGNVSYHAVAAPVTDPLGLVGYLSSRILEDYQDERDWLRMTARTRYPDAVVTLTRHMLWQDDLQFRELEYAPDLVVTARSGWYFGLQNSPGSMHGYPLADAMRATLFITGPNVRRGARVEEPCRLADLTPTILDIAGVPADPQEFDGIALASIYETEGDSDTTVAHPVYWSNVDLHAWDGLDYQPSAPSANLPISINRPSSPFDLTNIAYNLVTIGELSVLRLFDDMMFPLAEDEKGVSHAVQRAESRMRGVPIAPVAQAAGVLDVSGLSLADYNPTSQGNLQRFGRAIDWAQQRGRNIDEATASNAKQLRTKATGRTHTVIDSLQAGFWETYRFGQRIFIQILDEKILNSIENGTDRAINVLRSRPSEIIIDDEKAAGGNIE